MKGFWDVVEDVLHGIGADGFVNAQMGCGCHVPDLAPCQNPQAQCLVAKAVAVENRETDYEMRPLPLGG